MKQKKTVIRDKEMTGKQIQRKILKKGISFLITIVVLCAFFVGTALIIGYGRYNIFFKKFKIQPFYDFVITMGTILAAIVIFYYSAQDSRREGVPRRTITTYWCGSYTIPFMFALQMLGMFTASLLLAYNNQCLLLFDLLYVLLIQVTLIAIIMLTSSSCICRRIIVRTEKRQFGYLVKYKNISDKEYIWNYLIRHMEQAVEGQDMLYDRMAIIRELLEVPGVIKGRYDCFAKDPSLMQRWRQISHEYYFSNITAALARLHKEDEDVFLSVLTEFLLGKDREVEIILSVMLAVLYGGDEKAGYFCTYVINGIRDKDSKNHEGLYSEVVTLYFLALEFLYRVKPKNYCYIDVDGLRELWKSYIYENNGKDEEKRIGCYLPYWLSWAEVVSMPEMRSLRYYRRAMKGLLRKSWQVDSISYLYSMAKDNSDANKNIAINE